MRRLVLLGKVVDQALRIFGSVVDDAGEVPLSARVVMIETLLDEFGMLVIAGEDDGLGEPVAPLRLVAVLHQVLQDFVHRVAVEQPIFDRRRIDLRGQAVLVGIVPPVQAFPPGLLFVAERVVVDPLAGELQIDLPHPGRHQKTVRHRRLQFVGIGRHPRLQLEQLVGVAIHHLARGGGQAHQQGVEISGLVLISAKKSNN